MSSFAATAFRMFGQVSENIIPYFPDLKSDLKRAGMKTSLQEYVSLTLMTSLIIFVFEIPTLAFIFSLVFQSFLFGFTTAILSSILLTIGFFIFFLHSPKFTIQNKAKEIDNSLPFASLYLSTIFESKLPLHKAFEIFSKFSGYGAIKKEIDMINQDIKMFGLDINTALERGVERASSKNLKELLWGILFTSRSGGDLSIYFKEKARNLMAEYRRKISEFARSLTVYIEVYMTAMVLGTIFFTILTAIMSGISGTAGNIITLQFIIIFIFLPVISILFIFLIKSVTPGGE